jgi:hypothetical protein
MDALAFLITISTVTFIIGAILGFLVARAIYR